MQDHSHIIIILYSDRLLHNFISQRIRQEFRGELMRSLVDFGLLIALFLISLLRWTAKGSNFSIDLSTECLTKHAHIKL